MKKGYTILELMDNFHRFNTGMKNGYTLLKKLKNYQTFKHKEKVEGLLVK